MEERCEEEEKEMMISMKEALEAWKEFDDKGDFEQKRSEEMRSFLEKLEELMGKVEKEIGEMEKRKEDMEEIEILMEISGAREKGSDMKEKIM